MIPKIIHYCWFGGNTLPELTKNCIRSWQKYCPDYEIKEWNDRNFEFHDCIYVQEAYAAKKWAFVSDYARLKVLVEEGGVYMDTDVEVTQPIDKFLSEHAFSGFEDARNVPTGILACEKGFPLFVELLNRYNNRRFLKPDGTYDLTTNVQEITDYLVARGLLPNNRKQTIEGFTLYPKDFFCPKSHATGKIEITENTHTIHHFTGSWLTPWEKCKKEIKVLIGSENVERLYKFRSLFRND